MMTVRSHWLLVTTMALMTFLALLGWGAYAYSANLSATLSKQRGERDGAIAKITADREALAAAQQQLLSEQQRLMTEQKRLQNELARANAQLAVAREKAALLPPREEAAEESEKPRAGSLEPPRQAAQESGVEPGPEVVTAPARANAKARCPRDKFWRVSLGTCVSKKAQPQHYTVRLSRRERSGKSPAH
jgi:septal ring factor EnvC (AmiA/AmiB activator)